MNAHCTFECAECKNWNERCSRCRRCCAELKCNAFSPETIQHWIRVQNCTKKDGKRHQNCYYLRKINCAKCVWQLRCTRKKSLLRQIYFMQSAYCELRNPTNKKKKTRSQNQCEWSNITAPNAKYNSFTTSQAHWMEVKTVSGCWMILDTGAVAEYAFNYKLEWFGEWSDPRDVNNSEMKRTARYD